jgi:hypothetical protein
MPREFYADTQQGEATGNECLNEIEMFDGPGICMRPKGHKVTEMAKIDDPAGQFHQEGFEGWVWNNKNQVG